MTYRVGVIGCGFFAQNHLAAWSSIKDVELASVCDLDLGKSQRAKETFGATSSYTDAEEMLKREQLDFVDIATTMESHEKLITLAASYKTDTIVQKPLAPTWESCLRIADVAKENDIRLMVHENTRFLRSIRIAHETLRSNAIGIPTWARISFRTAHNIYQKQPYLVREERFAILDLGVHMIDLARFLLGEVNTLYCQTNRVNPSIRGEDQATIMLRHLNGATSIVEASYASQILPDPFPEVYLEIEGTDGSLRLNHGYKLSVFSKKQLYEIDVSPTLLPWSERPWHGAQESVLRAQENWVSSLRAGHEPETSIEDSLKTYALVFGAYDSAARNVAISPLR